MTPPRGRTPTRRKPLRLLALGDITASCIGLGLGAFLHSGGTGHGEAWLLWSLAGLTLGTGLLAAAAS